MITGGLNDKEAEASVERGRDKMKHLSAGTTLSRLTKLLLNTKKGERR